MSFCFCSVMEKAEWFVPLGITKQDVSRFNLLRLSVSVAVCLSVNSRNSTNEQIPFFGRKYWMFSRPWTQTLVNWSLKKKAVLSLLCQSSWNKNISVSQMRKRMGEKNIWITIQWCHYLFICNNTPFEPCETRDHRTGNSDVDSNTKGNTCTLSTREI